jgi:hypothetical protein
MTNKRVLIVIAASLVVLGGTVFWLKTSDQKYVTVTEDRNNSCKYDAGGKQTSTTLAVSNNVKVRMPAAEFEKYKKDAIAAGKCFY